MTGEPSQRAFLLLAVEVVRAAYEEALLKHGMLPSTVVLIHSYADANIAALDEAPDDQVATPLAGADSHDILEHSPPWAIPGG